MPPKMKKKVRFSNDVHFVHMPSRQDSTDQLPVHDPIGTHLMALRKFYRDLLIHQKSRNEKIVGFTKKLRPKMPDYPVGYPTNSYLYSLHVKRSELNQRPQLCFRSQITQARVDDIRTLAIKRILLMVGYEDNFDQDDDDNDNLPLKHLSYVSDVFLQSFVERLRFQKDSVAFRDDNNIWNPLETTLQEWGFGGVHGIAKYFYDEFAKMCEALSADCIYLIEEDKKKERAEKARKGRKLQKKRRPVEDDSEITLIEDDVCFMEIDNTAMVTQ